MSVLALKDRSRSKHLHYKNNVVLVIIYKINKDYPTDLSVGVDKIRVEKI